MDAVDYPSARRVNKRPTPRMGGIAMAAGIAAARAGVTGKAVDSAGRAVIEAAGTDASFRAAWELARPNAAVVLLAMYESPQTLPLPQMYGKNLVFKTGGVDGCHCADILRHIAAGELDASPLLTHVFALEEADRAYDVFEHRLGGAMKVALRPYCRGRRKPCRT